MSRWTLHDIEWAAFRGDQVDAGLLMLVKAAALVEINGADYTTYLCNVFRDDERFKRAALNWGGEEVRHGEALGRWAELADPAFDFAAAVRKFREGYRVPLDTDASVRGSHSGELLARCMVETGTSSYYAAMRDAAREPVLKQICDFIHHDELRHYQLFHFHLQHYLKREPLSLYARLKIGTGRIAETGDDELSYAFHCGNGLPEPYDREHAAREYRRRAWRLYGPEHFDDAMRLGSHAVNLPLPAVLRRPLARAITWGLRHPSA